MINHPELTELINRTLLAVDEAARTIGCAPTALHAYIDRLYVDTSGCCTDPDSVAYYVSEIAGEASLFSYVETCEYVVSRVQELTCIDELEVVLMADNEEYRGFKPRKPKFEDIFKIWSEAKDSIL